MRRASYPLPTHTTTHTHANARVPQSNFNADRVRNAAKALKARGTSLSSNQVQYSLLYRKPETNGGERAAAPRLLAGRTSLRAARGWRERARPPAAAARSSAPPWSTNPPLFPRPRAQCLRRARRRA